MIENEATLITDAVSIQYQYIANLLFVLLIFILLCVILNFLISRKQIGHLLIKLPLRGQGMIIFLYSNFIFITLYPILNKIQLFMYPLESITRILFVSYFLLRLFMNNPPSIREKGILTAGGFAKWEKIRYYKWTVNPMKPDDYILIISTSMFFGDIWRLTINTSQKESIDTILKQYLFLEK
ncbi:DUF5673 domain-containing protein [Anabaena cylindrica UHCC 0172]|uniref:DUF5673 domain-containing protein n=1 Tax=Anabaena cylindrica TaxID=1165 RepID=UPI002B20D5E2|nr:DUF5673 domain-containing protein [Anabaena cylindrica]MEA5553226.1 DUF5673 domain-containing protein [Anabaena cylindrica UHCC 0172]